LRGSVDTSRPGYGLVRIRRRGLGNELFAWARCRIWCDREGSRFLKAHWRQVHVGPYLRGERDKRHYHELFRTDFGYSWTRVPALLGTGYRIVAEDRHAEVLRPKIVVFDGMRDCFRSLWGHEREVMNALSMAARPAHLAPTKLRSPWIAVHIRLGDFAPAAAGELLAGAVNRRIEIEWFSLAISALRATLGQHLTVVVYSDGSDDEVFPLLTVTKNCRRAPPASALADMLSMSSALALVSSGSTFSAWASYLGQVPTLSHRGQLLYPTRPPGGSEVEWMPGENLDDALLVAANSRLAGRWDG
jgi:hypothetical protein